MLETTPSSYYFQHQKDQIQVSSSAKPFLLSEIKVKSIKNYTNNVLEKKVTWLKRYHAKKCTSYSRIYY